MGVMEKRYKKYDSRGAINTGDSYWERNYPAVPESSESFKKNEDEDRKREEILLKIEEKKRLIHLTKAMPYDKEMGMSSEKAQRTIELLNKDISNLEKEFRKLESNPENFKISSLFKPLDDEMKTQVYKGLEEDSSVNVQNNIDIAINSPPKVEKKYQTEYVGTTFHNDSVMEDTPIKSLNWYAIIILLIIISSSLYYVIGINSQNTNHVAPSNFSNNNAEKVINPILTPKNIFDKINEYREQNKKYKILWSDDAYRLADFRASDMVKRNYFSRTNPDGKTVSDYIGKYNFYSDSAWGENLCKACSDPAQTWIESAGHREVLLGGWGKGAVACDSDICVFIGVNE